MNKWLNWICLLCSVAICLRSHAQLAPLRVMSYNMLNFPLGEIPDRVDTLEKIVSYSLPDLLMIQELKTEQGLLDIADMMDSLGFGDYAPSQFVAMQSDPGNPYPLQHAIVYNQNIFTLKSQSEIVTSVRDINEFVLYLNDDGLATGSDTIFIYVYVTHLKSSTGAENQALRLEMANAWIDYMNANFIGDENVILAGDFNLYANTEPAYLALTNTENTVVMQDMFASLGNWSGTNFEHKEILTQSTRSSQVGGDGAGGGIDDRFDFILFSEAMMTNTNEVYYVQDSYKSLGNNGTCYNQSITECSEGNGVPQEVLQAIYYLSDHVPQVCLLGRDLTSSVQEVRTPNYSCSVAYSTYTTSIKLHAAQGAQGYWTVYNSAGQIIQHENVNIIKGNNTIDLNTTSLQAGIYFFLFQNTDGSHIATPFIVN
jgi:Endonuclease/Exonuclease/phosphatase family